MHFKLQNFSQKSVNRGWISGEAFENPWTAAEFSARLFWLFLIVFNTWWWPNFFRFIILTHLWRFYHIKFYIIDLLLICFLLLLFDLLSCFLIGSGKWNVYVCMLHICVSYIYIYRANLQRTLSLSLNNLCVMSLLVIKYTINYKMTFSLS